MNDEARGRHSAIFLVDVDNTLLDNDEVERDLKAYLERVFGRECQMRYWQIFEELRAELGYADYLGALQRYRVEHIRDPHLLEASLYLVDYPFANRLYPGALDVIKRLTTWGPTVILSDGDVVFQPRKVQRSGLWDAVQGQVLIYIHKEQMLADVEERYPSSHYIMIDDKLRILAAMKEVWRDRLTTVFVRQGHYAHDAQVLADFPPADRTIDSIGEILGYEIEGLVNATSGQGNRKRAHRARA
jgi:FMN phosphatase YigB (HAD superfamily)